MCYSKSAVAQPPSSPGDATGFHGSLLLSLQVVNHLLSIASPTPIAAHSGLFLSVSHSEALREDMIGSVSAHHLRWIELSDTPDLIGHRLAYTLAGFGKGTIPPPAPSQANCL